MLSNYAFDPLPVADRLKPDHDAAFESLMNALHPQATMPVAPMPSAQLPPYLSLSTPSYKFVSWPPFSLSYSFRKAGIYQRPHVDQNPRDYVLDM